MNAVFSCTGLLRLTVTVTAAETVVLFVLSVAMA